MTTYRKATSASTKTPVATFVLPVSAWAGDFAGRPGEEVCVGLRLPSEQDIQVARAEAARMAWELHPKPEDQDNRIDCFNDGCMRWILAKAICQPNDALMPYFEMSEDIVPYAFNTVGMQLLWDALEKAYEGVSPLQPAPATDEELDTLVSLVKAAPSSEQPRYRRKAAALLAELQRA